MWWSIVPVILTVLNVVASRIDLIDQNEILFLPGDINQLRNDVDSKKFTSSLNNIEMKNFENQHQEQNKYNDKYNINSRKIIAMNTMDDSTFDDSDDLKIDDTYDIGLYELSNYLSLLLEESAQIALLDNIEELPVNIDVNVDGLDNYKIYKRSKNPPRYPWKRQNGSYRSRNILEAESLYLCKPSREDVIRLLMALHDVRQGKSTRTVNFCKRKRPVGNVITNIRFLGRRK